MKIQLLKNVTILDKNKINHNGNFAIVEEYIKSNSEPSYDPEFISKGEMNLNGKTIQQTKFSATFIHGENGFNTKEISNYNSAVIFDYPYLPDIKSFWIIKSKKLESSNSWTINFEIDLFTTFGISKIDLSKPIRISRKHISDYDQFESGTIASKLKADSILRHQQPSNDFQFITQKKPSIFYNEREDKLKNNLGLNESIFLIWTLGLDMFSDVWDSATFVAYGNKTYAGDFYLSNPDIQIITPLGEKQIKYKDDASSDVYESRPRILFEKWLDDSRVLSAKVVDFLPDPALNTTTETSDILTLDESGTMLVASTTESNSVFGFAKSNKGFENMGVVYKINEDLFDYEITNLDFSEEADISWNKKQVIALQFEPFRSYEIGISTEEFGSNNSFSAGDLEYMPIKDLELLSRKWSYSTQEFSIIDEILNKDRGNEFYKLNRSFDLALATDPWKEANQQKLNRVAQNIALPAASAAAGAAVGGPAGAAVGFGLSTTNTILKNQKLKNTPDTITSTSSDLRTEALAGYNTRTLKIRKPDNFSETILAQELHKYGLYHFEAQLKLTEQELFPKYRFNYLEISPMESTDIIKDLDQEYKEIYLKQLQNGIVVWDYDNEVKREHFLNYEIKNPDREHTLEKGIPKNTYKDITLGTKKPKRKRKINVCVAKESNNENQKEKEQFDKNVKNGVVEYLEKINYTPEISTGKKKKKRTNKKGGKLKWLKLL